MKSSKFFKPNKKLVKSLVKYFDNRLVVEIGSGSCHVIKKLFEAGHTRIAGVDPHPGKRILHHNSNIVNIISTRIQDVPALLNNAEALILICRPCHSGFVQYCIENKHPDSELLYIGLEENFDIDGILDTKYEVINLKGSSEDDEVIISIK